MLTWILAVLGLYVLQTILPTSLKVLGARDRQAVMADQLRAKDLPLEASLTAARLERALNNMKEALPVFLPLAVLCVVQGLNSGLATTGAAIFFVARVLYIPAYVTAIPGVRTTVWTAGWVGLGVMIAALVG